MKKGTPNGWSNSNGSVSLGESEKTIGDGVVLGEHR